MCSTIHFFLYIIIFVTLTSLHYIIVSTYLDLSLMLSWRGGNLLSCGGDVAGDPFAEPHDEEPEFEEDIELVLCLFDGIP